MMFFVGLIDQESGDRHVLKGKAYPTIEDMEDLTHGGLSRLKCDWGTEASEEAAIMTAVYVLKNFTPGHVERDVAKEYAEAVIRSMESLEKWMLTEAEVKSWLEARVKVN